MNSFKKCREKKGLTQKEVAYRLKMSIQAISYWENGERMPSYDRLFQLADLYETTTDELLGRIAPHESEHASISYLYDETQLVLEYRKLTEENKGYIRKNIRILIDQQNNEEKDGSMTTA